MKRFAFVLAACLCVPAVAGAQPSRATTKVVSYSAGSMHASARVTGHCWTSSIASRRADAFRCMAGNQIYDPCFTLDAKSVACPEATAPEDGTVVRLTAPLPPAQSPPATPQVWAMILQSGNHCNRATGTVDPNYPYYCSGPLGQCREPDIGRKKPAYYVNCANFKDGKWHDVTSVLVEIAYE